MGNRKAISIVVPLLLLTLALLAGSILLLRLFFVSLLMVAVGLIWVSLNLRNLSVVTAPPPKHPQVGDFFQREVRISNSGRLPRLWVTLTDNTNLPGPQDTAIANVPGKGVYSWQTTFRCRKRGRFHLGPVTISTTDLLGLFSGRRALGNRHEITVLPATFDLPFFRYASFNQFGFGSGYQSLSRISTNASSVREYASGDSLHHIHWPTTARTGQLMVKMFDADRSHNATKTAWILLDMNEESHFSRGDSDSAETAITIAASLAKKYVHEGLRVGVAASDAQSYFVEPDRGDDHGWAILETLALMRGDWKTKLCDAVTEHMEVFRDNPMVILVATSATSNLIETVHQLRTRVDSVVVILLDIESFGGRESAAEVSRAILWAGGQVYTVQQGEELGAALDSKSSRLHPLQASRGA